MAPMAAVAPFRSENYGPGQQHWEKGGGGAIWFVEETLHSSAFLLLILEPSCDPEIEFI